MFVGMKPATANGGSLTVPTGWTLQESLTGAGGYGTTLGADTGNTNLWCLTKTGAFTDFGTLTVSIGNNNVAWALIVRFDKTGPGSILYGSAYGQRTTTPTSPMSIALTNGATPTDLKIDDFVIWAMCIPTDVTTPSQFSAQNITATGVTFQLLSEINEPDSSVGNDIGGYSAFCQVASGSSTTAPTVITNLSGTLTNVRGPVVLLRIRDTDHSTAGNFLGPGATLSGTARRFRTFDTTGTLTGPGSTLSGSASRSRAFTASGALTGPGSILSGAANRSQTTVTAGGGQSGKFKQSRPMWVVGGKIFDSPWVAQEYLATLQAEKVVADARAKAETRKPAPKTKPQAEPQAEPQRQFLVLQQERIEIDLSRFSYADDMAQDSIEAHMQLARVIVEERDAQVAMILAIAMLDD